MSDGISLSIIIGILSVLVGLLCLVLAVTALLRARKAPKRAAEGVPETKADLYNFAAKQMVSAAVMVILAVIIFIFS